MKNININKLEKDKYCNSCQTTDENINYYEIHFGQTIIMLCGDCANWFNKDLSESLKNNCVKEIVTSSPDTKHTDAEPIKTETEQPLNTNFQKPTKRYIKEPQVLETDYTNYDFNFNDIISGSSIINCGCVMSDREPKRKDAPTNKDYKDLKTLLSDFCIDKISIPIFATIAEMEKWQKQIIAKRLKTATA